MSKPGYRFVVSEEDARKLKSYKVIFSTEKETCTLFPDLLNKFVLSINDKMETSSVFTNSLDFVYSRFETVTGYNISRKQMDTNLKKNLDNMILIQIWSEKEPRLATDKFSDIFYTEFYTEDFFLNFCCFCQNNVKNMIKCNCGHDTTGALDHFYLIPTNTENHSLWLLPFWGKEKKSKATVEVKKEEVEETDIETDNDSNKGLKLSEVIENDINMNYIHSDDVLKPKNQDELFCNNENRRIAENMIDQQININKIPPTLMNVIHILDEKIKRFNRVSGYNEIDPDKMMLDFNRSKIVNLSNMRENVFNLIAKATEVFCADINLNGPNKEMLLIREIIDNDEKAIPDIYKKKYEFVWNKGTSSEMKTQYFKDIRTLFEITNAFCVLRKNDKVYSVPMFGNMEPLMPVILGRMDIDDDTEFLSYKIDFVRSLETTEIRILRSKFTTEIKLFYTGMRYSHSVKNESGDFEDVYQMPLSDDKLNSEFKEVRDSCKGNVTIVAWDIMMHPISIRTNGKRTILVFTKDIKTENKFLYDMVHDHADYRIFFPNRNNEQISYVLLFVELSNNLSVENFLMKTYGTDYMGVYYNNGRVYYLESFLRNLHNLEVITTKPKPMNRLFINYEKLMEWKRERMRYFLARMYVPFMKSFDEMFVKTKYRVIKGSNEAYLTKF